MTFTLEPENASILAHHAVLAISVLLCITQFVMAHEILLDVHNVLSGAYHHINCQCLPPHLKHLICI